VGRTRFLPRCLIALVLSIAACGVSEEELLEAGDMDALYLNAEGSAYGKTGAGVGVISGRVSFKGAADPRKPLDLTTQDGFCIQANRPAGMLSEDFLVGKDGALGNVIVYVKKGLDTEKWPVPTEPVVLDQIKCQYIPHVAVIQVGQPLIVKSSDNTSHNVHGAPGANDEFNKPMSRPGQMAPRQFRKKEIAKRIYCDVHGWMESWVAVLPHPVHALTKADGTFTIENVPEGKYLLAAWHEELGELTMEIVVEPNGTVTQEITFE